MSLSRRGSLAERSKALASGASPKGREFESHNCQFFLLLFLGKDATGHVLKCISIARLAQSVERKTLNLVVVGSSPTVGTVIFVFGSVSPS